MDRTQAIAKIAEAVAKSHGDIFAVFFCKKIATEIYDANYRLIPELKVLSDEEIKAKLEKIQPEGFNWADTTKSEYIKFNAIAQAQCDKDKRQLLEGENGSKN